MDEVRVIREILRGYALEALELCSESEVIDSVTVHADVIDDLPYIDVAAHRGKERVVSVSEIYGGVA